MERIDETLRRAGVDNRYSMLVVPNFWSQWPLEDHPHFKEWLRLKEEEGVEMILHGYYHKDHETHTAPSARLQARLMTAGEGEFLGLEYEEAASRILAGRKVLQSILKRPVEGFVAPAWLYGEQTRKVLRDQGFGFAEDHWSVWTPAGADRTLCRSPVISYSARTRSRIVTSWLWSRFSVAAFGRVRVLRQAIHPHDLDSPGIFSEIERALAALMSRRELIQYRDLVSPA